MSPLNRISVTVVLLLAVAQFAALADSGIVIEHNWSVIGPGGHYGVFQYQTGPGPFDARTVVTLGPRHFQIPAPLFAVLAVGGLLVLGCFALCLRGVFSEPRASNKRA